MNTDFEYQWRSGLRRLRADAEPARDLWPQIAARMTATSPRRGVALRALAGLAASAVVALGAGLLVQRAGWLASAPDAAPLAAATTMTAPFDPAPNAPLSWAVPSNPTLAAAAHDLDDANAELQTALEQRPNAVFLVGLLNRTNSQRMRLLRTAYPG